MALAKADTPLRLADGTLVYPGGRTESVARSEPEFVEIPTHAEAQRIITATRRKLADLPEMPRTMNTISVVLSYSLFGLDDEEIGIATGLGVEQIGRIKMSDPYTQMHEGIVRTIMESETTIVRDLLAQNARSAAMVVVDSLSAPSRADRMAAAKDILDRSGHRPSDVVEHRHRMEGGLVIEIVRKDANALPVIDIDKEDM